MTRATVEEGTAGLGQTFRTGGPVVAAPTRQGKNIRRVKTVCFFLFSASLAGDHTVSSCRTHLSFVRRSVLRVSGTTTALVFASCRIVNWWLTAGSVEGIVVAGVNIGSPTSGEKSLQHWAGSSVLVGACRRWRLTNRGLKWIQAVCLTMSG